jgi:LCP family protein required for cell wall assembly
VAEGEKPYRVYRGGRARGEVPLDGRKPAPQAGKRPGATPPKTPRGGQARGPTRPRRKRRVGRWIALGAFLLVLLLVVWSVGAYLALASGDKRAQQRLPASAKAALTKDGGLLLSHTTDILVLGIDHSASVARAGDNHSDSMLLIRIGGGRTVFLSIPRDLRVDIPGHGSDRINAAMQSGGAALAIKTVSGYLKYPVNHVVVVDFAGFRKLIDKVGGITVNVPAPIHANRFDCPYSARRCASWTGWRFAKGAQHMNGTRALVYSRVRENQLNKADTDVSRGSRQQAVLAGLKAKLLGVGTLLNLPFMGGELLDPVATDLSAGQLLQLMWVVKARGGTQVHCRLGGTSYGGLILPNEADNAVRNEIFDSRVALTPPDVGRYGLYAPGCSTSVLH